MRNYVFAFLAGCLLGVGLLLFESEKPMERDSRVEDSLRSSIKMQDSLINAGNKAIDSLIAEIEHINQDSSRIITRYETRIKYIDSYRPDQLDSILAARYKP